MILPDRIRPRALVILYAAMALVWVACARWVVFPLLTVDHPGPTVAAVNRYLQGSPALFLTRDIPSCWRNFSVAVLIALLLHVTILLIARQHDRQAADGKDWSHGRGGPGAGRMLGWISAAFLAVAVLTGANHDYYFYLQMWYEVRQGHDPWFRVAGLNGIVPLNAYGPAFNVLAVLSWVNPLAPKLLFAYAYILFTIASMKNFTPAGPASRLRSIVVAALFWNPFPWVEIAIRGHFDILIGLSCLGAIRAWVRGRDRLSGTYLAMGVLLKYLPVVLIPFLALNRGRLRPRFLVTATALIAIGLGLSCTLWGQSTWLPLRFAASRRSTGLSIFAFIRGHYSPLSRLAIDPNIDHLAPLVLFLGLLRAWSWYRVRQPNIEAAALVAVLTTVLFYRTGYPQYQMVPFVLGASWVIDHWDSFRGRAARIVATAGYFGWLALFDFYYSFVDEGMGNFYWYWTRDAVGLPSFLFGCAFLLAVVRSARDDGHRPDREMSHDRNS